MKTRNLFLGMLAMAGMLFATSCSKDELQSVPQEEGFVEATFTIATTDGIGTRAEIGDASNVNRVACTIYDENGTEMNLYDVVEFDQTTGKAYYNVRLAKGQNYTAAFFAYTDNDTDKEDGKSAYYDATDLNEIKILNANSNIEERDAFTGNEPILAEELTNGNVSKTVTLKRPFAQLNLGIDAAEYNDAKNAGIVVEKSSITVTNVWNAWSAYTGNIAANAQQVEMTFGLNNIPVPDLKADLDEDSADETYEYLALNYILVGTHSSTNSTTQVTFTWKTLDGKTNNPATQFINIPVERNFRTNIIGRLLTSPTDFTIEIDAEFTKPDKNQIIETINEKTVTTVAELVAAVNNAPEGRTTIKVGSDLSSTTPIELDQQKKAQILIDGQNHTFDLKIIVDGNNNWTGSEEMTFQNMKFNYTGTDDEIFSIATDDASTGNSYAHNINIMNCTFDGPAAATAIKANQAFDMTIQDCTAQNLHSFSQISSSVGVTIDKVTSECVRGIHVDARNFVVSNCVIKTTGSQKYGIRSEIGNVNDGFKIINCNIDAYIPVVVRNHDNVAVSSYTLTFEGTNTLTRQTGSAYDVVIAEKEYPDYTPVALPNVTVTGADSSWSIFK